MFSSDYFFSSIPLNFSPLFDDVNFAWEALHRIVSFFESQDMGEIKSSIPSGVFVENRDHLFVDENDLSHVLRL